MVRLVNALRQNARKFRRPPKGPLGAMIKLRDYRWARSVESCLGFSTLVAFIVDNQEDAHTFKTIMRTALQGERIHPDAITTRFEASYLSPGSARLA